MTPVVPAVDEPLGTSVEGPAEVAVEVICRLWDSVELREESEFDRDSSTLTTGAGPVLEDGGPDPIEAEGESERELREKGGVEERVGRENI